MPSWLEEAAEIFDYIVARMTELEDAAITEAVENFIDEATRG